MSAAAATPPPRPPIDWALAAAARGWPVLPLNGKVPRNDNGSRGATKSVPKIREWWSRWPDANIGIATGSASGLVVIDIDGPDGELGIRNLEGRLGPLPVGYYVTTARGRHVYLTIPPGVQVPNRAKIAPEVDVRGEGGYVVGPGSVHPDTGEIYEQHGENPSSAPASWLDWVVSRPERTDPAQPKSSPDNAYRRNLLRKAIMRMESAAEGERNDRLNAEAYACAQYGIDRALAEAELTAAAARAGLVGPEVAKTFGSGWKSGAAHPKEPPGRTLVLAVSNGQTEQRAKLNITREDPLAQLRRNEDGNVRNTLGNAVILVDSLGKLFAFDMFKSRPMVMRRPPWPDVAERYPRPLRDSDSTRCAQWIEMQYGTAIKRGCVTDAIDALAEVNPFDPLKDYLLGLTWDGIERCESWLTDLFGVQRSPLTEQFARRWLVSAAARGLTPGCQADHMLVLEGGQGKGKSTGLAALAGAEWFSDEALDVRSKDAALALHGIWIFEWGELASMNRREVNDVKNYLTRKEDRYRPPYGRQRVDVPRRTVFAGSNNDHDWHRDASGGRRFWPVVCGSVRVDLVHKIRDQLWAEAVHRFKKGEQWYLECQEMMDAAAEQIDERFEAHPWEERILTYIQGRTPISTADILDGIGIPIRDQVRSAEMVVAQTLKRAGYTQRREIVVGVRARRWHPGRA